MMMSNTLTLILRGAFLGNSVGLLSSRSDALFVRLIEEFFTCELRVELLTTDLVVRCSLK